MRNINQSTPRRLARRWTLDNARWRLRPRILIMSRGLRRKDEGIEWRDGQQRARRCPTVCARNVVRLLINV